MKRGDILEGILFWIFTSIAVIVILTSGKDVEYREIIDVVVKRDEVPVLLFETGIFTATVYNATPKQCNGDYLVTASGFKLDSCSQYPHRICAVSRDLLKEFSYGDSIYVTGTGKYDGWWHIEDTMNKRYRKRIDLLIDQEMDIGKWKVQVFKKNME